MVAALLSRGRVLPAVSLGKHPLPAPLPIGVAILPRQGMGQHHSSPTRCQILLMEAANVLEMPIQSLALACGQQRTAIVPIQGAGRPPRQSIPDRLMLRGQGIGGVS